jgi:hypothetical protein
MRRAEEGMERDQISSSEAKGGEEEGREKVTAE